MLVSTPGGGLIRVLFYPKPGEPSEHPAFYLVSLQDGAGGIRTPDPLATTATALLIEPRARPGRRLSTLCLLLVTIALPTEHDLLLDLHHVVHGEAPADLGADAADGDGPALDEHRLVRLLFGGLGEGVLAVVAVVVVGEGEADSADQAEEEEEEELARHDGGSKDARLLLSLSGDDGVRYWWSGAFPSAVYI